MQLTQYTTPHPCQTVYTEQARRIEEAYRTAVESNAAAFEQALRTIITVLGPAGTDAGGDGSGSSPWQQQLQEQKNLQAQLSSPRSRRQQSLCGKVHRRP